MAGFDVEAAPAEAEGVQDAAHLQRIPAAVCCRVRLVGRADAGVLQDGARGLRHLALLVYGDHVRLVVDDEDFEAELAAGYVVLDEEVHAARAPARAWPVAWAVAWVVGLVGVCRGCAAVRGRGVRVRGAGVCGVVGVGVGW